MPAARGFFVGIRPELVVTVVGIIDGDSVRLMHEGTVEQIRLSGIDPPEGKQPFGT
jgi:endonuclease YncB( thermonuclease family)